MTRLPSTSVALSFIFLSSPDKAWSGYDFVNHFSIIVQSTRLLEPPTEVHIQITFSLYSYSHEFVGSALARFELSTLPEHKGTRTVVLHSLKIITPLKCVIPLYDGFICCPKEGELHRRTKYTSELVWSVNILTDQKVMWNHLFNYFGIHSLFNMYQVFDSTA